MMLFAPILAILAYGSQSVLSSRSIPAAVLAICTILFIRGKHFYRICFAITALGILILTEIPALRNLWPLSSVLATVTMAAFLLMSKHREWLGSLKLKSRLVGFSVGLGLISFAGVAGWVWLASVSADQIPFKIPASFDTPEIVVLIFVFAILNSFAEEFLFRGLALQCFVGSSLLLANTAQAIGFALLHFKGFPFGISGALLAGVFAFGLGCFRIKCGSLIYPWITHFTANLAMGLLLFQMSR